MSVGDILDGAFKLLRANAGSAVIITAALIVPLAFVTAYLGRHALGGESIFSVLDDPSRVEGTSTSAAEILLLYGSVLARYLLFPFFIGAALSPVVEASYLGSERSAGEATRIALRVLPALIGAWLLTRLLWTLGLFFCVLPAFAVSTCFVVAAPTLVIERLGAVAALRRSVRLVRPMFWRVLLISVLAGVIGYFVDNALGTVPQLAALMIGTDLAWPLLAVGQIVGSLVTMPFVAMVAILLYYDGRIRHEGFDLQLMAADLARPATEATNLARPATEATNLARPATEATNLARPATEAGNGVATRRRRGVVGSGVALAMAALVALATSPARAGELPTPQRSPAEVHRTIRDVLSRREFRRKAPSPIERARTSGARPAEPAARVAVPRRPRHGVGMGHSRWAVRGRDRPQRALCPLDHTRPRPADDVARPAAPLGA